MIGGVAGSQNFIFSNELLSKSDFGSLRIVYSIILLRQCDVLILATVI